MATASGTQALPIFYNFKATDKDGQMTPDAMLFHDQTNQALNNRITIFGVNVPSFTAAEISAFTSTPTIGTIWFNSDLNALQFQGKTGIQKITSSV